MVAKRRTKKKTTPRRQLLDGLAVVTRVEVVGLSLVLISVFTLLSLLTGSRGSVTGLWIDLLRDATGDGVAGVPLLTGFLGLWMVLRAIEGPDRRKSSRDGGRSGGEMPVLPWRVPTGLLLIFLAYIAAITLSLPPMTRASRVLDGRAGGALGLFFANTLVDAAPGLGGWAVILLVALAGLSLLTGRRLWDGLWVASRAAGLDMWGLLQKMWREERRKDLFRSRAGEREERGEAVAPPSTPISPDAHVPQAAESRQHPLSEELVESDNAVTAIDADRRLKSGNGRAEPTWELPQLSDMLDFWDRSIDSDDLIRFRGRLLEETLALFGVPADFEGVNAGPTVTQYLIRPGYTERTVRGEVKRTKVKVSKIASLSNDLALALAARTVRIEAPIPGTSYVGIEVPNTESNNVGLKELMEGEEFEAIKTRGRLPIALGEDVRGKPVVTDLARMPHLLIAGATGTGKSVCINSIIGCLLLTHTPETLRMLMIDPKMVELTVYNGTPHLLSPVVTDVDRAAGVLFWCIKEMERRYQLLNKAGVRDLERFNAHLRKLGEEILPYVVVIIDEMADLMMAAPEEVEKHVIRLAQMARAVGIHMIIATQRPSVDVITGLIKANFPARIAFAVTSQIDSRVVLDVPGAENLLGRGDMLFMAPDASKLERLQGAFLDDAETNRIVRYWQNFHNLETYIQAQEGNGQGREEDEQFPLFTPETSAIEERELPAAEGAAQRGESESLPLLEKEDERNGVGDQTQSDDGRDGLFDEAVQVVSEAGRGSVTILQRKLRVGYNRASRLVEQLEAAGILGPDRGQSQGREVYLRSAGERVPRREAEEPAMLPAAPSSPRKPDNGSAGSVTETNGTAGGGNGGSGAAGSGSVDGEQAELPPPSEENDAPPRIWM